MRMRSALSRGIACSRRSRVAATLVLARGAAAGAQASAPQPSDGVVGWRGLVGGRARAVAVGQRVHRRAEHAVARAARRARPAASRATRRSARWTRDRARRAAAAHRAARAQGVAVAARVQLRARARTASRRSLDARAIAAARARRPRSPASTRCASRTRPPSRSTLLARATSAPRGGSRPDVGCRARRARRDDRAARHRRRPRAPVPARPRPAGDRRRRRRRRRERRGRARTARTGSSGTGPRWPGILVGAGGPAGVDGVAPGASVLPIRVAGWQPDAIGALGRLRAHRPADRRARARGRPERRRRRPRRRADRARSASPSRTRPSPTRPRRGRSQGALQLDTLVVAPAGNDGPAGPGFGSISGPGGAPRRAHRRRGRPARDADGRRARRRARRARRRCSTGRVPLAGAVVLGPARPRARAALGPPSGTARRRACASSSTTTGRSLVAGRAALVRGGADPQLAIEYAARAGASAVVALRRRSSRPAGSASTRRSTSRSSGCRLRVAQAALAATQRATSTVAVSIGRPSVVHERQRGRCRAVLVARARVRRARQARPRRARCRRSRPPSPAPTTDGSPRFGTRQRLERRGRRGRRRRGAARAGAARPATRSSAQEPARTRQGALDPRESGHGAGRRARRPRRERGGRDRGLSGHARVRARRRAAAGTRRSRLVDPQRLVARTVCSSAIRSTGGGRALELAPKPPLGAAQAGRQRAGDAERAAERRAAPTAARPRARSLTRRPRRAAR